MTDTARLERLLKLFFGFERPEIVGFRRAVAQFKTDLPAVLKGRVALVLRLDHLALTNFRAAAEVVDKVLATNEYLVGNAFSAADILMASVLSFAKVVGLPIGDFRSLPTYLDRCKARPAFKRAIAD